MNPAKNILWDSRPESRSCFLGDSLWEPAMNKILAIALLTACVVNMACLLLGHL
jgi:hypothetical protein